jgi:hypothetical protein
LRSRRKTAAQQSMTYTDIRSKDRLVQQTFAAHLDGVLGWDTMYASGIDWDEDKGLPPCIRAFSH